MMIPQLIQKHNTYTSGLFKILTQQASYPLNKLPTK